MDMWLLFAILSSVFAALTSILAKIGIEGVNSNLATAIRTAVVLIMSWGMVFLTNAQKGLGDISQKSWIFLILSGLATGIFSGCIGTSQNVIPAHFARICKLAGENNFSEAAKLQAEVVRFVEVLVAKPNGSWHKSMMKYIGLDCGEGRAPNGRHLSKDELKDLFARLDALGFVGRNDASRKA